MHTTAIVSAIAFVAAAVMALTLLGAPRPRVTGSTETSVPGTVAVRGEKA